MLVAWLTIHRIEYSWAEKYELNARVARWILENLDNEGIVLD